MADTTDNARVCILCGTDRSRPDRETEEEKRFFQNRRQCNNCGRMRGDAGVHRTIAGASQANRVRDAEAAVVRAAKQWYEDPGEDTAYAISSAVRDLLEAEKA